MRKINTLIIPDVHCRDVWRKPVYDTLSNHPESDIVFLGDYLSPYPFEWDGYDTFTGTWDDKLRKECLDNGFEYLKEIIDLKKQNPERIHLLVGNHDGCCIGPLSVCECRYDYENQGRNISLYCKNQEQFQICFQKKIGGKDFLFSHAGITDGWLKSHDLKADNICDFINNKYFLSFKDDEEYLQFWALMKEMSYSRGGYDRDGSPIWADVNEHYFELSNPDFESKLNYVQVFGHTYLKNFAINLKNQRYCVDLRTAFYCDDEGNVKYYDNNEIVLDYFVLKK